MAPMDLLIAALVIAGWLTVWIRSRSMLIRKCAGLRLEFQRQIESLSVSVKALEKAAAVPSYAAPSRTALEEDTTARTRARAQASEAQTTEEITPETLATITETITALIGRKIHVRSVKTLPTPHALANPWAQHGRAVVQASHNFSQRKREP